MVEKVISGWWCLQVDEGTKGAFEYGGVWWYARFSLTDQAALRRYEADLMTWGCEEV